MNALHDWRLLSRRLKIVAEAALEKMDDTDGKCSVSALQVASLSALGTGLKNNGRFFTGYPVVGFHNRLVPSSSCLLTADDDERVCAWDNRIRGLFFQQTTVSIDIDVLPGFIRDIKALRDVRGPSALCNSDLYYGIIMRFVRSSTAYLGEQHDAVSVDITYYRSRDPRAPRLNEDVWEEIEQMAVFKYKGRPHWGKNRPIAFIGIASKYPNVGRFVAVKRRFDPQGLFSSEWSDAMLGLRPLPLSRAPGCALEGLCICSTDAHCAPDLGYLCQPGRIYPQARVCRKAD
jgi:FAD-dependent oxidoreductase